MSLTLELPAEYGYTITVAASSLLLHIYHAILAVGARRRSGIPYPNPYATAEQAEKDPKAMAFNCAQRAHANYTENITPFLGSLLISSLAFPRAGAALGAIWVVGRTWYAVGYTGRKGPPGRRPGFYLSFLSGMALSAMSVFASVKFLPQF
ncbi:hypothetical protein DL766_010517 [Monosporascus sp. MC13-8B]|uniref:Uncharacterized protein n=1 Tax=Monosporascus cannonballus TaxID=155416 RepID=A0ABY0HHJ2_9PEZI|nr:hypothetical protein DL762_001032 [Monosporascus cannonballus]RYP00101.1 hypothetical protein DL763_001030 [Monosporascus cannonballus]RYP02112.1 hypothetical protein DL766_010517 [Monosporascus sp. MC13-8B]